jgi:hypothetical protein
MTFAATVFTRYPEMFPGPLGVSLAGHAMAEGKWACYTVQIRDLAEVTAGLSSLDTDGHYSRPDEFKLKVDRRPRDGVHWDGAVDV